MIYNFLIKRLYTRLLAHIFFTVDMPQVRIQLTVLQVNKQDQRCLLALITMQNVHCNQIPHGQDRVRFGYAIKSISCHSQYCFLWICLYSILYASLSQLLRKNPNQTYIIFGQWHSFLASLKRANKVLSWDWFLNFSLIFM